MADDQINFMVMDSLQELTEFLETYPVMTCKNWEPPADLFTEEWISEMIEMIGIGMVAAGYHVTRFSETHEATPDAIHDMATLLRVLAQVTTTMLGVAIQDGVITPEEMEL